MFCFKFSILSHSCQSFMSLTSSTYRMGGCLGNEQLECLLDVLRLDMSSDLGYMYLRCFP